MRPYVAGFGPEETFAVLADAARTQGAMGIVLCTWEAAGEPSPHTMPDTDQAFVGLSGACALGDGLAIGPGQVAVVPRGSPVAVRVTDGPCRVLVILTPAGPEAYLSAASALPLLSSATLIALAADHGVVLHPRP